VTPVELLKRLDQLGISARQTGPDRLLLRPTPPAALIPDLRAAKAQILALLRVRSRVPQGVQPDGALWTWPDGSHHELLASLWADRGQTGFVDPEETTQ
jgi:hypothetical protein